MPYSYTCPLQSFLDLPVNRKIDVGLWDSSLLGSNITDERLIEEFYFGLY